MRYQTLGKNKNMKKLYNLFILDKSGSMDCVRQDTLNNLNEYIESIKHASQENDVDLLFTLLFFDTSVEFKKVNIPIIQVEKLNLQDYVPSGCTSLNDAIGVGISKVQNELGDVVNNPDVKIKVYILTDGQENSSQEYTVDKISRLIKQLSEDGKWEFQFIGCGGIEEVKQVADSYSISNSMACLSSSEFVVSQNALRNYTCNYIADYGKGIESKTKLEDFLIE